MGKKFNFLISLLILFYLINVYFCFVENRWPVGKDWHLHLSYAFKMMRNLERGISLKNLLIDGYQYPPFYYWSAIMVKKICFDYNKSIFLTSTVYFFVLLWSVYKIGYQLKNRNVALLSLFLCAFSPAIYKRIFQFNLDLAAAAFVGLTIYFVLKSEYFHKAKYAILAGISLGAGMLTRELLILFVAGPLLVTISGGKEKFCRMISGRTISIIIFFVIAFGIASIFYASPLAIENIIYRIPMLGKVEETNLFSLAHLTYYIKMLPIQVGGLAMIFFLYGLYILLSLERYYRNLLFLWILVPFVVFTFTTNKFDDYAVPYIAAIIIVIAIGIESIKNEKLQKFLALGLLVFNMCQFFREF